MAEDDATNTDADDGGEKDAPPSISDKMALSDEDHAALPPDQQIDREGLTAYRDGLTTSITETVTETLRTEAREAAAAAKAEREAAGVVQSEIDWYEENNRRRASSDPTVVAEAVKEFNEQQARWNDAHAEKAKVGGAAAKLSWQKEYYAEHLPGAEKEVAGYTAYLTEHAVDLNGNALLGALRFGREQGHAAGLTEGHETAEREGVDKRGAAGGPEGGKVAAGAERYLDDIDTKAAGAGGEIFRRAMERNARS